MNIFKNIVIPGASDKPIGLDIFYKNTPEKLPVVIYAHGFNGFKDWGNADIFAKQFAETGFVFIKFNFSHNGTSIEQPEDFVDLEAFGNNNYSKQLFDINELINWACSANGHHDFIDAESIFLIGHSMGGGMVTLKAATDQRIKKLVTWAGISECKTPWGGWPADKMNEWKLTRVQYYHNSRTQQQMPLYYQLYEDYENNQQLLNIQEAVSRLTIPLLICHGSVDSAVTIDKAYDLHKWQPASVLYTLKTDHVFGRKHPWEHNYLPEAMQKVVQRTISFLLNK